MTNIDSQSPAGSWQKEWDARSHSPEEFRHEIRELRDRIKGYIKDIEMRDQVIAELRDELTLLDKYWRKEISRE